MKQGKCYVKRRSESGKAFMLRPLFCESLCTASFGLCDVEREGEQSSCERMKMEWERERVNRGERV